MASLLEIATEVADDLSIEAPSSLFSSDLDATGRRLRRALTKTAKFLGAAYDWSVLRNTHAFKTITGEVQPGALPADLLRIVEGTMYDRTRGIELCGPMAAQSWQPAIGGRIGLSRPHWAQYGRDLRIIPSWTAGSTIAFEYIRNAICKTTPVPHTIERTTSGMTLAVGKRYIVGRGHIINLPPMQPGDYIEVLPEDVLWRDLGASFVTPGTAPIISTVPANAGDILTIVARGAGYEISEQFGAWKPDVVPTTNGMTLDPGRRYIVGQGHMLYVPVLATGEIIELLPATGDWDFLNARLIARNGLAIGGLNGMVGLVTLTADMTLSPSYFSARDRTDLDASIEGRWKPEFTADTDEPLWDKELMVLGCIWAINSRDGMAYGEDFRSFDRLMHDRIKTDGGSTGVISLSGRRQSAGHLVDQLKSNAVLIGDGSLTWDGSSW